MKEVTTLTQDDLMTIENLPGGELTVPLGFKVYKIEDLEEVKQQRIAELERSLIDMPEPSDEELMEEGKMSHPYYMMLEELEILKGE